MKGFKSTGKGPKSGFSFPSKAGFTGSTGRTQNVRGYTRAVPKRHFANGGMVVARGTDGGSSVTRRTQPVTEFDAEHGGKGPLRPGFDKGGKVKSSGPPKRLGYRNVETTRIVSNDMNEPVEDTIKEKRPPKFAEGGKVATTGAAIKLMKELMKRGDSSEGAATKAARRYGVSKSEVQTPTGPLGGGGMPANKQMLARGGLGKAIQRTATQVANTAMAGKPMGGIARGLGQNAGPIKPPPARIAPPPVASSTSPVASNHGYGSFQGRPLFGGR